MYTISIVIAYAFLATNGVSPRSSGEAKAVSQVLATVRGIELRSGMSQKDVRALLGDPTTQTIGWSTSEGSYRKMVYTQKGSRHTLELSFRNFPDGTKRLQEAKTHSKWGPFETYRTKRIPDPKDR